MLSGGLLCLCGPLFLRSSLPLQRGSLLRLLCSLPLQLSRSLRLLRSFLPLQLGRLLLRLGLLRGGQLLPLRSLRRRSLLLLLRDLLFALRLLGGLSLVLSLLRLLLALDLQLTLRSPLLLGGLLNDLLLPLGSPLRLLSDLPLLLDPLRLLLAPDLQLAVCLPPTLILQRRRLSRAHKLLRILSRALRLRLDLPSTPGPRPVLILRVSLSPLPRLPRLPTQRIRASLHLKADLLLRRDLTRQRGRGLRSSLNLTTDRLRTINLS